MLRLPGGRGLVAIARVSPSTHLFGDAITARFDVVVDTAQFDPDRLDVRLRFRPYQPVGAVRATRRDVGKLAHLRWDATLRCLHAACIAPRYQTALGAQEEGRAERYAIRLPPAQILYEERGGKTLLLQKPFPAVEEVSRLNTARAQGLDPDARPGSEGAFVASLEPPEPTYRARPAVLAALSLGAALLLALIPATMAGRAVRDRWRAAHRRGPLTPLDRALLLVDWSARRGDAEDRRKALEALAVVLAHDGVDPLADATRELAWAERSPEGGEAGEAGAEARRALAGRGSARAS